MVNPSKYPIDHIDLMAFLAREYQALILQIDSLQQEQSEVDLEKEIRLVLDDIDHEFFPVDPGEELSETDFINSLNRVARHFAQWGAEHLADARKTSPNDLEEAAIQYATHKKKSEEEEMETELPMGAYYLAKDSFIAGYNLCKEQMLKDAVEGRVFMSFAPGHNQMVMADVDLPTNTKVRVIVLPKED